MKDLLKPQSKLLFLKTNNFYLESQWQDTTLCLPPVGPLLAPVHGDQV